MDLEKYAVTLENSFVRNWDWLGGLSQITERYAVSDTGTGGTSVVTASFHFINGTLTYCSLSKDQGSIQYHEKAPSNVEAAATFLTRYQSYTGDLSINVMKSALNSIDASKNATLTVDNIRLEVTNGKFGATFSWQQTFNGAVYSSLTASFENGGLYAFSDDRSYYSIGSTEVKVAREDAIEIATITLNNFSYVYANQEVNDFSVAKDNISAVLNTRGKTNPLELYPYWTVDFPLDKVYPGSVAFIEVLIWADSGEAFEIRPMGYGGLVDDSNGTSTTIAPSLIETFNGSTPTLSSEPQVTNSLGNGDSNSAFPMGYMVIATVLVLTNFSLFCDNSKTTKELMACPVSRKSLRKSLNPFFPFSFFSSCIW
ncbi:MAG: hypothetical protein NWF05_06285 [Candidatus Bathyarchaeota archaeon]|nr:hypothetical protein [Candidatus Bathyarchaeota archaeon]